MSDEGTSVAVLKALASPTRLRILGMLADKELTLGEITAQFGPNIRRDYVFRHTEKLVNSNLVEKTYNKETKRIVYSLTKRQFDLREKGVKLTLKVDANR
jgi:DNA-binding transcriptional ArsR family regulator